MSSKNLGSLNSPDSDPIDQLDFEFPEYLMFDDHQWEEEVPVTMVPVHDQANEVDESVGNSMYIGEPSSGESGNVQKRMEGIERVAFKTKSEVEILDDGFKWRKYGKKMVKNSPNPRNYYKCSVKSCPVKKRIERDREDPRYVITTYEGFHNHESSSY